MTGDDLGRLIYLVLLGLAVGGWLMAEHRRSMGTFLRQAMVWTFIFIGAIAAVGLWNDVSNDLMPRQSVFAEEARVETPRAFDGHYYLTLHVNGVPVQFVVDTGATDLVLTRQDAERLGVDVAGLTFGGRAGTANGEVRTSRITVEQIALGPIVDYNVSVLINEGEMDTSLMGMSYLQTYDRIEISDNTMIMER